MADMSEFRDGIVHVRNLGMLSIFFSFRLWPFNYLQEGVSILRKWLTCDVTKVLRRGLTDGFMGKVLSMHILSV